MPPIEENTDVRLARIETKLDAILTGDTDHETRIRKLERWQYIATGLAAAAGSGIGAVISQVVAKV